MKEGEKSTEKKNEGPAPEDLVVFEDIDRRKMSVKPPLTFYVFSIVNLVYSLYTY